MTMSLSAMLCSGDARGWLSRRVLAAIAVVATGDWLFYDERPGLSLAVFALLLGIVSAAINPIRAKGKARWIGALCLMLAPLPVVVRLDPLSFAVLLAGLIAGALVLAAPGRIPALAFVSNMLATPFAGPFRLIQDASRWARLARPGGWRGAKARLGLDLAGWIVPLGLGAVFLGLFANANPVLEAWLSGFDPRYPLSLLSSGRIIFWIAILAASWPLLHVRGARLRARSRLAANGPIFDDAILGPMVIRRSLLLFNALFAVQTAMDIAYLWSGHALPEGMSYAAYAHRGAYPLMITALLAGAFVLEATHGRPCGRSLGLTRWLLLAFVAQNIMLVISSILRLDLYVGAYGLTTLRLAAGVWMALVAFGLLAIVIQIELRKSRAWLLAVNAIAVGAVLYAACFVNSADIVARFNLAHAAEDQAAPQSLDWAYLVSLGPQVIPALDAFIAAAPAPSSTLARAQTIRDALAGELMRPLGWRQWSYETWRLRRSLAKADSGEDRE